MIKKNIIKRLKQLANILENPSSLKARLSGCYFEIYNMLYRIKSLNIHPKTIIDIGANSGMFSKTANYLYKDSKIIAFEPLKECFTKLKKLSSTISTFECYNYAIGNKIEKSRIFKNPFDYSSSLLEMANLHKEAFHMPDKVEIEDIEVITLDKALHSRKLEKPILIKIDVQGYEKFVIDGASEILKETDILICELSFYNLYNNQVLFGEIYNQIIKLNFRFLGPIDELLHPQNNAVLQVDGLFIRNDLKTMLDL
jgi:FkbM family methyltransferase